MARFSCALALVLASTFVASSEGVRLKRSKMVHMTEVSSHEQETQEALEEKFNTEVEGQEEQEGSEAESTKKPRCCNAPCASHKDCGGRSIRNKDFFCCPNHHICMDSSTGGNYGPNCDRIKRSCSKSRADPIAQGVEIKCDPDDPHSFAQEAAEEDQAISMEDGPVEKSYFAEKKTIAGLLEVSKVADAASAVDRTGLELNIDHNRIIDLGSIIRTFLNTGLADSLIGLQTGVGSCTCSKGWSGIGFSNYEFTCSCTNISVQNPDLSLVQSDAMKGWRGWKHTNVVEIGQLDIEVRIETGWSQFADIRLLEINYLGIMQGEVHMECHASRPCWLGGESNFHVIMKMLAPDSASEQAGPSVVLGGLNIDGIALLLKRQGNRERSFGLETIRTKNLDRKLSSGGKIFKFILQNLFNNAKAKLKLIGDL